LRTSLLVGTASDSDIHGRPVPAFEFDRTGSWRRYQRRAWPSVRFAKWSKAEREQQQVFRGGGRDLSRRRVQYCEELVLPESRSLQLEHGQCHSSQRGPH